MTNSKAIEILKNDVPDTSDAWCDALDMAIKALESQRWIPCDERQPAEDGWYITCNERDGIWQRYFKREINTWSNGMIPLNDDHWNRPKYWMPLPQPYKEGEE